eukprot:scaffold21333_cov122-Isochrysis_galbana.AAC.1
MEKTADATEKTADATARLPGVAVDRCASFGVGVVRAGSFLLPGLGVVDRWVGHDCFTCVCCCLRPHTITPLPWRERGIQFPQHKNKHTSQARGDEARGKEGTRRRGKEPTPRVPREVDYRAGAPHPFRGREESC